MGELPLISSHALLLTTGLLHTSQYLHLLLSPLRAGVGREWRGATRERGGTTRARADGALRHTLLRRRGVLVGILPFQFSSGRRWRSSTVGRWRGAKVIIVVVVRLVVEGQRFELA